MINDWKNWEAPFEDLIAQNPVTLRNVYCGAAYGKGWHPVVAELTAKIEAYNQGKSDEDIIECHQIKEKFGGLRYYTGPGTEEVDQWIREAEQKAHNMCEFCGVSPVRGTKTGWFKRLCETHAVEWESR